MTANNDEIEANTELGGRVDPVVMRDLNCDQVAWMLDAIERYLPPDKHHPSVSQQRDMLKHGLLYEIMDVANLSFSDDAAISNATPWILKIKGNRTEGA